MIAAVLAAPAAVQAADGRIPIFRETLITQPGSYYVTRSFTASGGMPAITIATAGVTIDLNGHTITQSASSIPAIEVMLSGVSSGEIEIRGGQVDGGSHGISLQSATACLYGLAIRISHMAIQLQSGAAVDITNGCSPLAPTFLVNVSDSQLHWAPSGLHLQGVSEIRTDNLNVTGTSGPGIQVQDSAEWIGNSVIVGWPWGDGIQVNNVYSARLDAVQITKPTGHGLLMDGVWATTFTDLTIYDPTLSGIRLTNSADVNLEALWITSAGQNGIEVLDSNNVKVIHSVIGSSVGDGVLLDNVATSHLMYNTIRGSGGAGVRIMGSEAGTLCDNNMSGNQIGIEVGGGSEAIALLDNNVSHNLGDGIVMHGSFGAVERNHAARNGGVGIRLSPAAVENVYAGNRARGNALGGIVVPPGGTNIDGGGNL